MKRKCPNCSASTISVDRILFGNCRCETCGKVIGVHRIATRLFSVLILIVTSVTTFLVFLQMGFFAALVWFSLPIGAVSFIKARYSPLETKVAMSNPHSTHDC